MPDAPTPQTPTPVPPPSRSITEFATNWLALRRPARLVVDGLLLLVGAGIAFIAWSVFADMTRAYRMQPEETPVLVRNLGYAISGSYAAFWYLGVVVIAVGALRMLGDAIRGTGGEVRPPSATGDQEAR